MLVSRAQLQKILFTIFFTLLAIDFGSRVLDVGNIPVKSATNASNDTISQVPNPDQAIPSESLDAQQSIIDSELIKDENSLNRYEESADKDSIDASYRQRQKDTIDVLTIQYCTSNSYKEVYQQLAKDLGRKYPYLMINGAEYPTNPLRSKLAKLINVLYYVLYAILFAGDIIFQKLGIEPPSLYHKMANNKILSFFIIMIVVGNLGPMLATSGAFEIKLNDEVIFSKLKVGRLPSINELDKILQAYNV